MLIMGPDGDLENTGKIQLISVFCFLFSVHVFIILCQLLVKCSLCVSKSFWNTLFNILKSESEQMMISYNL